MCYTITIFSLFCCIALPAPASSDGRALEREQRGAGEACLIVWDMSQRATILSQAGKTAAPEDKAPVPEKKDEASGKTHEQSKPPQQKDEKPAPKDFVPSEQIDADKAVDFPADI